MPVILETPRLWLRELTANDLDFVAEMLADPDVMRFYPKRLDRAEARAWIDRQCQRYRDDGHGLWLAVERATSRPVGQVGLVRQFVRGAPESEIAYLIHQPYWRRGFATDAALGVRQYAFDTLGRRRVISLIRPENTPSQGVARKLGMTPEGNVQCLGLTHIVFAVSAPTRPDPLDR